MIEDYFSKKYTSTNYNLYLRTFWETLAFNFTLDQNGKNMYQLSTFAHRQLVCGRVAVILPAKKVEMKFKSYLPWS